MSKPRSVAAINASPAQQVQRDIGRIATLKAAIDKAEGKKQKDRVKALRAEIDRRIGNLQKAKTDIDAALAEINAG